MKIMWGILLQWHCYFCLFQDRIVFHRLENICYCVELGRWKVSQRHHANSQLQAMDSSCNTPNAGISLPGTPGGGGHDYTIVPDEQVSWWPSQSSHSSIIIIFFHLTYNLTHHRMFTSKVWIDDSRLLQESNLNTRQPRSAPHHVI